ncbi:MAG TPA: GNAT family N-acetyltransferase [Flavobacterium sp.]|jgi:N-acetylglutamate synthase-like GNAT family acetyltransferase
MVTIELINKQNPFYQGEIELRNKILLRPIGLPDHAWEMNDKKSWHFIALENNNVIGCVVLFPLDEQQSCAQLMQMAVEDDYQGKGIGKLLVLELLLFCRSQGIKEVVCHSRDTAVPFYLKLGFEIYDNPFIEVGIQHYHMKIVL